MASREAFCEGLKSPAVHHVLVDGADVALGSRQRRKSKSSKTKHKSRFRQEANVFMTSFHKINWIFERAFINSHVFASYEKTPCLFPDQAVSISNRRILFSCSGCFVLLFYFTTGASINNTQAARKNRDVITITNQPRFCDDVLEAIADAVGTEETSEPVKVGPHDPFFHPDTFVIKYR